MEDEPIITKNIRKILNRFYLCLLLIGFVILPWWQVFRFNEKIEDINHLQEYNEYLRKNNEQILSKLSDTIEARDLYANKYCLAINFSTTECKEFLREKIKREITLNSELDIFKKKLTENSLDK